MQKPKKVNRAGRQRDAHSRPYLLALPSSSWAPKKSLPDPPHSGKTHLLALCTFLSGSFFGSGVVPGTTWAPPGNNQGTPSAQPGNNPGRVGGSGKLLLPTHASHAPVLLGHLFKYLILLSFNYDFFCFLLNRSQIQKPRTLHFSPQPPCSSQAQPTLSVSLSFLLKIL